MLIDEIKNKTNLNENLGSSLTNFIANGQVDNDNFSLKKFINEIDKIENDRQTQVMEIPDESKEKENTTSSRRFGTKMKFSERFKDDDNEEQS